MFYYAAPACENQGSSAVNCQLHGQMENVLELSIQLQFELAVRELQ